MANKKNGENLLRYGNFKIDGIRDVFGHMTLMEIRSTSGNWRTKIDDGTFMFGLIKSVMGMSCTNGDRKMWDNYIHSLINVQYQFATSGCPVEILAELGRLFIEYREKTAKESEKPSEKSEKSDISDMRREQEMKEEFKKIQENER